MMLKELQATCFRSSKYIKPPNFVVSKGTGVFMLKAAAAETRKRTMPKEFPLAFVAMQAEEIKKEEKVNMGDSDMADQRQL